MDKIQKALAQMEPKERERILTLLKKILDSDFVGLDIKKLSGYENIFRARSGKIRIIFMKTGGQINILVISRRNEKTYRL